MKQRILVQQTIFHLACLYLYYSAVQAAVFKPGISDSYGGELKFLTKWTLYLSTLYHFSSVLVAVSMLVFGRDNDDSMSRSTVFCGILFPSSTIVCFAFWAIFAIHPDLMVPPAVRKLMPISGFYNHAVHTAPVLTCLLETFLVSHRPTKLVTNLLVWATYCASYLGWIFWVAYKTGVWVYPFLQVLGVVGKAAFFSGSLGMGFVFVKIVHTLCTRLNATKSDDSAAKIKQRRSKKER